jgi:ubiquinone/menaquinone biosynthesis C-methylase UbiE
MNGYSPKTYWHELAENYAQADAEGLAPVLHPGAPNWFNAQIDRLQMRAWHRALCCCALPGGAACLGVGCCTGRWLQRLLMCGYAPVGVDRTAGMLRLAVQNGVRSPLLNAELQQLPFREQSFDCVSSGTVGQHILPAQQHLALEEMVRVLRPGGYLILFEVIHGQADHVFSGHPANWIASVISLGPELINWFG